MADGEERREPLLWIVTRWKRSGAENDGCLSSGTEKSRRERERGKAGKNGAEEEETGRRIKSNFKF